MKKKGKLAVLSSVAVFLLALIIAASTLLPYYQITIDKFFLGQNAEFSEYDDSSARLVCEEIETEAQVLLKNEGNALPLKEKKVAVFGVGAYHMRYAGAGSGGGNAEGADTFIDALKSNGIEICQELYDYYYNKGSGETDTGGFDDVGREIGSSEISIAGLSDASKAAATAFTDTAIYVITRVGGEGSALTNTLLCMTKLEEQTLDYITENFSKVIVILNTSNQLELGFLDGKGTSRNTGDSFSKYAGKISAALWIGLPGYTGANAVVDVLCGTANPSGRLADTYAYDVDSALSVSAKGNAEGIYIGYKWYETAAYENVIDYDNYERTTQVAYSPFPVATGVQYPFGYGLSYTTFTKEIVSDGTTNSGTHFNADNKTDTITVKVKVTNTGSVAGKEVVQLYYTPPYKDNGIEKAYVNLAAFEKTGLLQPGESEIVTLTLKLSDMRSFDYNDANKNGFFGYELEAGNYLIRVLNNAHDWVNVTEESPLCITCWLDEDICYDKDPETGSDVNVRFSDYAGNREFVSRAGGFANLDAALKENNTEISYVNVDFSTETNNYVKGTDYNVELSDPIMFKDMIGVDFADSKWDVFISQLSKTELANLIAMGNFQTSEVERFGIPKTLEFDGPAAIKDTYKSDKGCLLYPSECSVGATWNKELMVTFGASAADDARQCGVTGWYAPGVNLHVNAYGGRNFEYFSEDAYLSGILAAYEVKGAQEHELLPVVKHLVEGMSSTLNEQALREIYARPFEIAIKEGEAHGLMTSYNVLGSWVGQTKELLTDIIRGEWGFVGMITSDAASPAMNVQYGIRAGNDIWLATDNGRFTTLVREEKNVGAMQTAVKHILQYISMSSNTMTSEVNEPNWSPSMVGMVAIDIVCGIGLCVCVFSIAKKVIKKKEQ